MATAPRALPGTRPLPPGGLVHRILSLARAQAGLDAAVLSEFAGGSQVIRMVQGRGQAFGLLPGQRVPFEDTLCRYALDTDPHGLVTDTRADPRVRKLAFPRARGIGSYLGAPVRFPDGRVYGSMFGVGARPSPHLDPRDSAFLGTLSALVGEELGRLEEARELKRRKARRIRDALATGNGLSMAFQPIADLATGEPVGLEALARFAGRPARGPDRWFVEAVEVGLARELEMAAVRVALSSLEEVPEGLFLSVNVSPEVMVFAGFLDLLAEVPAGRVVVELTEHSPVRNYERVREASQTVRAAGARVAVDDVGAGYANLRHVVKLCPDLIKLDVALTRDIHLDPVRRALAASFIAFAGEIGATIAAEGIETEAELETLRTLGVSLGQGFHLGRPERRIIAPSS
ncbi:MAG TPA: EAL domain-containing protein [Actinomycetota bacterium]|jgi:EAL domain-containing protein (putative c-di-GMP-specific phosphodiesterase class I)